MVTKSEYFIIDTKLRELRQQRSRLQRLYDELQKQAEQEQTPAGRIQMLYHGLRQISLASHKLHPDIANLEPLLHEIAMGQPSEEILLAWQTRLEKELTNGRLRPEIAHLFGTLLEEWAQEQSKLPFKSVSTEEQAALTTLVDRITRPAETGTYSVLLDELLADTAISSEEKAQYWQQALSSDFKQSAGLMSSNEDFDPFLDPEPGDLKLILEQLSSSPYHSSSLRWQARKFLNDAVMQKELKDTLDISLEHLDEWNWPQEGVPVSALWSMHKWRLALDDDLPTACLLEIMGQRLQKATQVFLKGIQNKQLQRLRQQYQQQDKKVDDALLQQVACLDLLYDIDIWNGQWAGKEQELLEELQDTTSPIHNGYMTINQARLKLKDELHGNGKGEYTSPVGGLASTSLRLLFAELTLAHAIAPDRPIYVVKLDLREFYPSLSHDLLLDILTRLGCTSSQIAFFRKYFQVPLLYNEQIVQTQSGIPIFYHLSQALAEILSYLLDQYVLRNARVQIVRYVDDICLLAVSQEEILQAWHAVEVFCQTCGLTLNTEKCGAVCVGDTTPLPVELPSRLPTWQMISLNAQGTWKVNQQEFETFREGARQQVLQADSLISRIEIYNAHLGYLGRTLALSINLGEAHRQSIDLALEHFQQSFFGAGQSILAHIQQTVRERFLADNPHLQIPEAWFYWPITAGGCGLLHASMQASSYVLDERSNPTVPALLPDRWQYTNNLWANFYQALLVELSPNSPVSNLVMETLVQDFIHRMAESPQAKKNSLTPYWHWILYIYGPQILERLGTFRFLIAELVPLQLIVRQYRDELRQN